jgi:signal transduction histidine kinase
MDPAVTARPPGLTRWLGPGLLAPAATVAVAVTGLRLSGLGTADAIGFALAIAWALAGLVTARKGGVADARAVAWLIALGALTGAVALTAAQIGTSGPQHAARIVATVSASLVIAISFHFLLALPDGRLARPGRRIVAGLGYATAVGTGIGLAVADQPFPVMAGALIWPLAVACALPAARLRYQRAAGHDKEQMQWLGTGLVTAAIIALISAVLHLLVGWPGPAGAVAAGASAAVPLAVILAEWPPAARHGGQAFVHTITAAGSVVVIAAIYLVIVAGLGKAPATDAERELLGLSMLAAVVAAIGFLPTRGRLVASATRFVYGTREAPGEALRTFGSRMTRAVAMDELLLQLAESLRKTMRLDCAEIYTGTGDVLERMVSVPDTGGKSFVLTDRERPVVARAGVSGSAWASVWLPALLEGRDQAQLRVAPISHAGELLGLIVIERAARADSFTDEDDRVLTDLARQAGLAFHNSRLDSALQSTLDALRKQADELRESRTRIVASGDAERRRVERDLHDGAQQHLVALAINLRLARDIAADDPAAVDEMLGQLADDVQLTIKELRELAHGIYPPLLADNGLGDALRAAASRSPLKVRVAVADDVGRYPAEVEAAIYFSCMEALQNAAKHAQQATVDLRLWTEAGGLLFSVADDGPGFDPAAARGGHGHVNMADRLGAIGGTVRWESRPGHGATISGSVPLVPLQAGEGAGVPVAPQLAQGVGAEVLLVDVGGGPAGCSARRQVGYVMGRAQEDHHVRVGRHDAPGGLDTVHLGHVDVHQHQRRAQLVHERDGLRAAGRLARQLEAVKTA